MTLILAFVNDSISKDYSNIIARNKTANDGRTILKNHDDIIIIELAKK